MGQREDNVGTLEDAAAKVRENVISDSLTA